MMAGSMYRKFSQSWNLASWKMRVTHAVSLEGTHGEVNPATAGRDYRIPRGRHSAIWHMHTAYRDTSSHRRLLVGKLPETDLPAHFSLRRSTTGSTSRQHYSSTLHLSFATPPINDSPYRRWRRVPHTVRPVSVETVQNGRHLDVHLLEHGPRGAQSELVGQTEVVERPQVGAEVECRGLSAAQTPVQQNGGVDRTARGEHRPDHVPWETTDHSVRP